MQIRVYYEDTDAGGIVYHSNYLNFCERARSEMFFKKGHLPIIDGGHFVVRHLEAEFLKSARFADELHIVSTLVALNNASFTMRQDIFRDDEKLFTMISTIVYVKEGKLRRLDSAKKELLKGLLT